MLWKSPLPKEIKRGDANRPGVETIMSSSWIDFCSGWSPEHTPGNNSSLAITSAASFYSNSKEHLVRKISRKCGKDHCYVFTAVIAIRNDMITALLGFLTMLNCSLILRKPWMYTENTNKKNPFLAHAVTNDSFVLVSVLPREKNGEEKSSNTCISVFLGLIYSNFSERSQFCKSADQDWAQIYPWYVWPFANPFAKFEETGPVGVLSRGDHWDDVPGTWTGDPDVFTQPHM